jgi:hypothetical protein
LAGQRGYAVCISYLCNGTAAAAVVGEIKQTGASAIGVAADVISEPDVFRLFKIVDESLGPITSVSLARDGYTWANVVCHAARSALLIRELSR